VNEALAVYVIGKQHSRAIP